MAGLSCGDPIAPHLRRFFDPQVEQLGMSAVEFCGGVRAAGSNAAGEGELWALQIDESCLVVAHEVTLFGDFTLEEDSPRSLCAASLSRAGIPLCPFPSPPGALRRTENIAVFEQGGRTVNRLSAADSFDSVALCALPAYFDGLEARFGKAVAQHARGLLEAPGGVRTGGSEPYVRAALRAIGSVRSGSIPAKRLMARRAQGVFALLATEDFEARRALDLRGCADSARLAAQVRCLVEANPAEAPTVEEMARTFSVSRSRLCAVFKQEMSESVGAFATRKRMELACCLLEDRNLSIEDVARAAGYRHQSSFAEAFKRAIGETPTAWRATRHA